MNRSVVLKPITIDQRGQTLRGTFYHCGDETHRCPTVVLLHGFTGNRIESDFMFVSLGRSLASAGIHAVTFDFRGSGESDGRFDQMLVSGELADALRVLDWVPGRPGVDRTRMGLLGFSLGGLVAACASARFTGLKALTLLAPTTTKHLHRHAKAGEPGVPVAIGPHTLRSDFFEDLNQLDPLRDVVKHARPTLLVHGVADKAVPPAVGAEYVAAMQLAGIPLQAEWIAGANHAFSSPSQRQQMIRRVTEFFSKQL